VALAIDASTPVAATNAVGTTTTVTTANFTPPAGALLLNLWAGNTEASINPFTPTITDSLGTPLIYTLLDWQSRADTPTVAGQAADWSAVVGSSVAMTVTVTSGTATGNRQSALQTVVLTGQHATPIGAHGKSGSASASSIAQNFTGTASGSWGFIVVCDWDALGSMTAGTGCTLIATGTIPTTQISWGMFRRTTADGTNGGTTTMNVNLAGTSTHVSWAYAEVVPAASASSIPWAPRPLGLARDYGEVQWIQGPRKFTDLVATAANDLAVPLLVAEQQRYLYLQAAAIRDRRLVPQQRAYVSDPLLLTTAELENELLGGATTASRYLRAATHVDRRLVPQQRQLESEPAMLGTAELEGALLGGADGPKRYLMPVTHADRREVPQQRQLESDPGLLSTAELEGALLGGGDLARRYLVPATHDDRRLVPAQRAYASDPSFYPVSGATDPLTLAWGAGGAYWHLYNDARVERREVPQQRQLESDPGLLLTAELEDALLGWGDTPRHHLVAATHRDRRLVPTQRLYFDPALLLTALLENELLGGAETRKRHMPALFVDRREVPQQRPYVSDPLLLTTALLEPPLILTVRRIHTERRSLAYQLRTFDLSPFLATPADPLTVAWGAGGSLWHRYQTAVELYARIWAPQQRYARPIFSAGISADGRIVTTTSTSRAVSTDVAGSSTTTTDSGRIISTDASNRITSTHEGGRL
jgi:hypothetical protein